MVAGATGGTEDAWPLAPKHLAPVRRAYPSSPSEYESHGFQKRGHAIQPASIRKQRFVSV